jgi:hypothetical protein
LIPAPGVIVANDLLSRQRSRHCIERLARIVRIKLDQKSALPTIDEDAGFAERPSFAGPMRSARGLYS